MNVWRRTTVTALAVLASTFVPLQIVEARSFRNCAELRKSFPEGVARDYNVEFSAAFDVNANVYRVNRKLDFDRDGVICERNVTTTINATSTTIAVQGTVNTVASTTTSLPRIPPSGDWDGEMLYDSKILSMYKPYMHVICTSGTPNKSLTLSVSVNGTWVKRTESYPTVTDLQGWCPNLSYPVAHRFYWVPDWPGTPLDQYTSTLSIKVTGLSSDAFYSRRAFSSTSSESAYWSNGISNVVRNLECAFGFVTCPKKP